MPKNRNKTNRQRKPPLTLLTLPDLIKHNIVSLLEYTERQRLAACSKGCKQMADKVDLDIDELHYYNGHGQVWMKIIVKNEVIVFREAMKYQETRVKVNNFVRDVSKVDVMTAFLAILRRKHTRIGWLSVRSYSPECPSRGDSIQLHVRKLTLRLADTGLFERWMRVTTFRRAPSIIHLESLQDRYPFGRCLQMAAAKELQVDGAYLMTDKLLLECNATNLHILHNSEITSKGINAFIKKIRSSTGRQIYPINTYVSIESRYRIDWKTVLKGLSSETGRRKYIFLGGSELGNWEGENMGDEHGEEEYYNEDESRMIRMAEGLSRRKGRVRDEEVYHSNNSPSRVYDEYNEREDHKEYEPNNAHEDEEYEESEEEEEEEEVQEVGEENATSSNDEDVPCYIVKMDNDRNIVIFKHPRYFERTVEFIIERNSLKR